MGLNGVFFLRKKIISRYITATPRQLLAGYDYFASNCRLYALIKIFQLLYLALPDGHRSNIPLNGYRLVSPDPENFRRCTMCPSQQFSLRKLSDTELYAPYGTYQEAQLGGPDAVLCSSVLETDDITSSCSVSLSLM